MRTHPWKESPPPPPPPPPPLVGIGRTDTDKKQQQQKQQKKKGSATSVKRVVTVRPISEGTTSSSPGSDCIDAADRLLAGDIVEQISFPCGRYSALAAPFRNLSLGLVSQLQDVLLQSYDLASAMLVHVRVLRVGDSSPSRDLEPATVPAFLVHQEEPTMKKKKKNSGIGSCDGSGSRKQSARRRPIVCLLHTTDDAHACAFVDSTLDACIALQETRLAQLASRLTAITLKEVYYVPAPASWESKTQSSSSSSSSTTAFSVVFFPRMSPTTSSSSHAGGSYANADDTVSRAMAWLAASRASGVPIALLNLQIEPLLTRVADQSTRSAMNAATWEDMCATSNEGIYGIEDYHGIDIGILRSVRLWFVPAVAEIPVVLQPKGFTLGIRISRSEEGFCYVSSVMSGTIAEKAGLATLLSSAESKGQLLVISKVEEEKITPTVVSTYGSVRCYDTMSISQKLATHCRLGQSIRIHVLAHAYDADKHRTKETISCNHHQKNFTQSNLETNTVHTCIDPASPSSYNSADSHGNSTSSSNSILIDRIGSFSFRV